MIDAADLMSLPAYNAYRTEHRKRLITHRRMRTVPLGPAMRLQFEDELTIRYQIQEVLRVEKVHDAAGMQQEIDTYAHLLPDGSHWKATLLIELRDAGERERLLPLLHEAAQRLYVQAGRQPRAWGHANEDLENRHSHRPSAVHFVRFALPDALRSALLHEPTAVLGCDHPRYHWRRSIPPQSLARLRQDLAAPARRVAPMAPLSPSSAATTAPVVLPPAFANSLVAPR